MSWEQLQNFFVVLLAICGGISVIGGAVNLLRSWKKESRLNTHSNILAFGEGIYIKHVFLELIRHIKLLLYHQYP
mgnify:CR=1 FL=1